MTEEGRKEVERRRKGESGGREGVEGGSGGRKWREGVKGRMGSSILLTWFFSFTVFDRLFKSSIDRMIEHVD